jgi:cobalt-zinc-cadmium efflux system outer membrane protein
MFFFLRAALVAASLVAGPALADPLTLEQAVARATASAPVLAANAAAVDAARGGRLQAGVRPNPVVAVEVENVIGVPLGPTFNEQAQVTGIYEQRLERGGKRTARIALAQADIAVAEAAGAVLRLDLAQQVQRAFGDVLLADEVVAVAGRNLAIERELAAEARRRVAAARDPLFVGTAADARVATAALALSQAKTRAASARAALAQYWGENGDGLQVVGDPLTLPRAGPLAAVDAQVATAEMARARAGLANEQALARQDWTVGAGPRWIRQTESVALVATVSIPLGRFDRNEGNIARARAERARAEFAAEASRLDRQRQLDRLARDAALAAAEASAIRTDLLPRHRKALAQVREGYARGGFAFRDLQDAADRIIAAEDDYLMALAALRSANADIDRLTGRLAAAAGADTELEIR